MVSVKGRIEIVSYIAQFLWFFVTILSLVTLLGSCLYIYFKLGFPQFPPSFPLYILSV